MLPDLVDSAGIKSLELFSRLLTVAVKFSKHQDERPDSDGNSVIWRPAIEDHSQNSDHGVRCVVVTAVRDAAVRLAAVSDDDLQAVVGMLESGTVLHRRIALHVLAVVAGGTELAAERIANRDIFEDYRLKHEDAGQAPLICPWPGLSQDSRRSRRQGVFRRVGLDTLVGEFGAQLGSGMVPLTMRSSMTHCPLTLANFLDEAGSRYYVGVNINLIDATSVLVIYGVNVDKLKRSGPCNLETMDLPIRDGPTRSTATGRSSAALHVLERARGPMLLGGVCLLVQFSALRSPVSRSR